MVYKKNMNQNGYLEVIAGPMYCGKTEELIRQVKRATIGKKKVKVFKHSIDNRYGTDKKLYSHAGITFESELISHAHEILDLIDTKTEMVAIDEAQWFGEPLIGVVEKLLKKNIHVIVSGLATTFDRRPFMPIPHLLSIADKATKLSAVCVICGSDAVFHKRVSDIKIKADALDPDPGFVSKLDDSVFEARCRNCFDKP